MECGKLTAKLRDAVPVCFIENGKEIKRFKNIEIPDEIKALPFADFKFDVPMSGAITFKIMFEAGILPTEWPQARERKSRSAKAATVTPVESTQADETMQEAEQETTALAIIQPNPLAAIIEAAGQAEIIEATEPETEQPAEATTEEDETAQEEPTTMEIAYHVTGEQRKALVKAVSSFTGETAKYQNAPTFAFIIGEYMVDKNGTLTGPENKQLLQALAAQNSIEE